MDQDDFQEETQYFGCLGSWDINGSLQLFLLFLGLNMFHVPFELKQRSYGYQNNTIMLKRLEDYDGSLT